MAEKTNKTVRLIYGCVLSAMTVILGALFIWQMVDAYHTGVDYVDAMKETDPTATVYIFNQSDVFARVARISPAFWIWVVMIVAGFVLWEVFPVQLKRTAYKDNCYTLMRLKKRVPQTVGEELKESYDFVKREERIIQILWLCCGVVGLAGIIYTIVYLATPSHFPNIAVNKEIVNMVKNVLPFAFAVFAVACAITVYENISAKKQLEHVKKLAAGNKPQAVEHGKVYEILHHKYFILGVRIAVGCIAVAFIIAGSAAKNADGTNNLLNVLAKAVKICSECIGLG